MFRITILPIANNGFHSDFEQPNDSTELEEYEEYCRRELPRVVRATVEEIVYSETQPLADRLIASQARVYANFRSTCTPNTANRSGCDSISKSLAEGSTSTRQNTPIHFRNQQLRLSTLTSPPITSRIELARQENTVHNSSNLRSSSDPRYRSNLVVPRSPAQTSIGPNELNRHSHQAATLVISQSQGVAFETNLWDTRRGVSIVTQWFQLGAKW